MRATIDTLLLLLLLLPWPFSPVAFNLPFPLQAQNLSTRGGGGLLILNELIAATECVVGSILRSFASRHRERGVPAHV